MPRSDSRRAVVLAHPWHAEALAGLFEESPLEGWSGAVADSVEQARFLVQLQACDALLVDDSALEPLGEPNLEWLTTRGTVPVVFISESDPEAVRHALAEDVHLWLPRSLVFGRPELLAAGLEHAVRCRSARQPTVDPDSRVRLQRLADLLWNALPWRDRPSILSQRYLLERLHEEVVRAERHNTPLTVVLAEVGYQECPDESAARAWTAERIVTGKRRSDLVGQYGENGLLLVLPHTGPEGAEQVCRRLRRDLEQAPGNLHASFAVACLSAAARSSRGLLRLVEERIEQGQATVTSPVSPSSLPGRTS